MPELQDYMYCSQQICIPPAFPYLLRQYCKAAIRTQPSDLLRWSTAYWRCLSLNIPPPVKPRLEYPLPQCRIGITPGWLKALLYQLQGAISIPYKVLWDRWIGACLEHDALIEVLVLGGFTDPYDIPWFRFVGICAGYLSESLTQTMMLVCEILTEEPEGGSAMVPLEIFLDVYTYLAQLEAGRPQTLKNLIFTDSLLSLLREEKVKVEKVIKTPSVITEEEVEIVEEEEEVEAMEEVAKEVDLTKVVSCPDIVSDEFKPEEEDTLATLEKAQKEELAKTEGQEPFEPIEVEAEEEEEPEEEQQEEEEEEEKEEVKAEAKVEEEEVILLDKTLEEEEEKAEGEKEEEGEDDKKKKKKKRKKEADELSAATVTDEVPVRQRDLDAAAEEAARRRALMMLEEGEEEYGEDKEWEELEQLKAQLAAQVPKEPSIKGEEPCRSIEEEEIPGEEEKVYQDVYIDPIPGIGPKVPCEMVKTVVDYMKRMATKQHGMVMPRNIRHFLCPPLEILET